MPRLSESKLIVLSTGQLIGHPITRRALKRQLRQARLQRREAYRELRREGLSYNEARERVGGGNLCPD